MPPHTSLKSHLRTIRRSTRLMARAVKKLTSQLREVERVDARKVEPPKRTLRITPKRRAQLKLQGAYLGYMRQLKPAQKAAVKAVREKRGFEAAISVAKLTLSK